jgi:eukaryotic-like serine/threonine-protein kinase
VTPERLREIEELFHEARERPPATREAFLEGACASDPALRREVESLLAQTPAGVIDAPVGALIADLLSPTSPRPSSGSSVSTEPAPDAEQHFPGTARFRVVRRLGSGGMGVVYEVHDRVRDDVVALKTMRRTSAAGLYRLKREFRQLADVTHPNLVCLYELFVEDGRCFFTMELVEGVSFVDYVRGPDRVHRADDRLRHALRQLVDGVSALHRNGKLHRDIKPSNILVTPEGRVVILDFGLIADTLPQHVGEFSYVSGGTPAYMAPEASSSATPSEAGDWYSVGVTLYQALTGTIPFSGPVRDVLFSKNTIDPPTPLQVAPDVPGDLSAICMGLLCRDPRQRLSGPEVLRTLARDVASPAPDPRPAAIGDAPFVGREPQLHRLDEAFDAVTRGDAATVSLHGPSGIGKSALLRRFVGQIGARADVVVLSGRCYENESVPYKALDGVVDDLSRYLGSLPRQQVESLMPPDVPALTRVFPVILQVDAIAAAARDREPGSVDQVGLRRRAFEALRGLLGRLADRGRLVCCIDDLQWADADSVVLLEELLRPQSPPAMLTVLCFRSEEMAAKPFLRSLLERAGRDTWSAIALEPMTPEEAQRLIGGLLPAGATLTDQDKSRMTGEAGGSPFVLEQLARHAAVNTVDANQPPTLAEMFDTWLAAVSPDGRRFLETLAICGRPMAPELICDACGVARERQSLVASLRSSHFIRSSGSSELIETYHDRIREALAARIAPDGIRRIHGLVVRTLVERGSNDSEALYEHYRGAGDHDNASIQAGLAAARAGASLAFDRAAFFFRQALALNPASTAAATWREGFANALANAGRPAEAAEAYLDAAAGTGHGPRVELQRRAAEQFLIGGHIDRGLDLLRALLPGVGIRAARSPRAALLSLLWRRVRLQWRGLRFVSRRVEDIDADTLLRLDTCWSAATGLSMVDVVGAADFSACHLHMALDAGEPARLARGMALESAVRGAHPIGRRSSERLVLQSQALARHSGSPHAIALSVLAEGITAMTAGEWKRALRLSEQASAVLRDQSVGLTWELNVAQNLAIWALMYLGELLEVSMRVPALLADARSRGNLYLATELCTRSTYVWLVADDPDEGEREAIGSIAQWSHKGFHRQHFSAMLARVQIALYRGDGEAAWRLLADHEGMLRRSYLTRVQIIRIEFLFLRARSALMIAARNRSRRFLSFARAAARRIARERMPWSDPIALLLRAGIAYLEGNTPLAVRRLHDAADRFERADMKLYLAGTRRRIGALQDDPHGRELLRQADAWMAAQNITNPTSMTRLLAPGFPDLP